MENLYSLVAVSPRIATRKYSESTGGEQAQSHQPSPNPAGDPLALCYQYLLQRALERQAAEAAEVAI